MKNYKLLLAEDDSTLGYILKEYLEMNQFTVILARDGNEGWEKYTNHQVHLCILDVMMPKMDGFVLAKKIKESNKWMPILFLTAKSLKIDKLKGFHIGGDDYIIKPVDEEELLARIHVFLRRTYEDKKQDSFIQVADVRFNVTSKTLEISEASYNLTEKEAILLKYLFDYKNQLLSREIALKNIWEKNDYFNRRSMDVHISKLRKLLKKSKKVSISNVHGRGYRLTVIED
jgi:DNA-binding response OmpR family regulator